MTQRRLQDRLDLVDQEREELKVEVEGIQKKLLRLPTIEENLASMSKSVALFVSELAGFRSRTGATTTGESSTPTRMNTLTPKEGSYQRRKRRTKHYNRKREEDCGDRGKFKKVEMPIFNGDDLDSWLFQADGYFQIHKLTDYEKLIVVVISFEGVALNWYRGKEEQKPFTSWEDLKLGLLARFRKAKKGSVLGRFLAIRQETMITDYGNEFELLTTPIPHVSKDVLENTFMNGLKPMIKVEVLCWQLVGLDKMMEMAQLVEDCKQTCFDKYARMA